MTQPLLDVIYMVLIIKAYLKSTYTQVNIEIDHIYYTICLYIHILMSSLDMICVYIIHVRDMYFIIMSTYCVPFM